MSSASQPIPTPINTSRSRTDSIMGSPSSGTSGFSPLNSPLSLVFTESSQISEEPSETVPSTTHSVTRNNEAPESTRPQYNQNPSGLSLRRKSSDSFGPPTRKLTFNEFGRGRHSNIWLFRGLSVRETVRRML